MANEAQVRVGLSVTKRSGSITQIDYRSPVSAFSLDVIGTKGPCVGSVTVTTFGTDVNLSEMSQPGLCVFHNQDSTNYVSVGVFDPETNVFYPFAEVGPGESYIVKLSRDFGEQFAGTGTGTTAATNRLRIKANTAPCVVEVDVFES